MSASDESAAGDINGDLDGFEEILAAPTPPAAAGAVGTAPLPRAIDEGTFVINRNNNNNNNNRNSNNNVNNNNNNDVSNIDNNQSGQGTLFAQALVLAQQGQVQCRRLRTVELQLTDDTHFLAALHCLRQGLSQMFAQDGVPLWFAATGRDVLCRLLTRYGTATAALEAALNALSDFLKASFTEQEGRNIMEELGPRGVVCLSFYDLALDFILLDAFDELKVRRGELFSGYYWCCFYCFVRG